MMRGLAAAVVIALTAAGSASAVGVAGKTTLQQTIVPTGSGDFRLLAGGPGETYVVRQEGIGTALANRASRRRSLIYFTQLTDFQLADEESPARVEFIDKAGGVVSAAWRPEEALNPQNIDAAIRQVNAFVARSPVAQAGNDRARMALAVLTGDNADNMQRNESVWVRQLLDGGRLDPNSGVEPTPVYTGVQDYDDGLVKDTFFYDPDSPEGPQAAWPRYPGLLDRAQRAFTTPGLAVPSYVTFGNHDGLEQGNQAGNSTFESIAVGSTKVFGNGVPAPVPADPRRQLVNKKQYMDIFRASGPLGHGFGLVDQTTQSTSAGAAGHYAWKPGPGMRFIALDTLCEGGVTGPAAEGNLDNPQFQWLERQLQDATRQDEAVVLFSHHSAGHMICAVPDEAAPPCTGTDSHGHDSNPGCDADPRNSAPVRLGTEVDDLVHRFPHVIAWVAGHTHNNVVEPITRSGGGFWSVRTASEIDWPAQSRLLELMDNRDGTLSLFGTIIDHAGATEIPNSGSTAAGFSDLQLASISRVFAFNDPQQGNGAGDKNDRNVELLIRDPRRNPVVPGGTARCASVAGRIRGKTVHRARLGRKRSTNRRRYPTRRRRGAFDHFCLSDGKRVRVGYATRKLRRQLPRGLRRRVRGRAVLALTNSTRLRVKRVRPGMRTRTMRRRVRGERRVLRRRGVTWYVARTKRARAVFRVSGGRVREVGLASRRLARTRRGARRLIRSF